MLPEEYQYTSWQDIPPDVRALQQVIPLAQPEPVGDEPHFERVEEIQLPDIILD